jgi:hypothetical protein
MSFWISIGSEPTMRRVRASSRAERHSVAMVLNVE